MNNPIGARRPALSRKTLLIVAAAIAIVLACVTVALSDCCSGMTFGMMPPDKIMIGPDLYQKVVDRNGVETILKNHQNLVTVTLDRKTGTYVIGDPRHPGEAVMSLPPASPIKALPVPVLKR